MVMSEDGKIKQFRENAKTIGDVHKGRANGLQS
jgi:hypothetical protein